MVTQLKNRLYWWKDESLVDAVARYLDTIEQWDSQDIDYMRSKPWKYDEEFARYNGWLNDLPF